MGWTDLFKSRSAKLRPDPKFRWFGKLPSYQDYYSNADEGFAVEFCDWVLGGYEMYRSRQKSHAEAEGLPKTTQRLPLASCAIRLPKSEMTLIGSILDFGGDMVGRPFPMCFFAGVPTAMWPGPTSDLMHGVSRVMRDLVAVRREVPSFLNAPGPLSAHFGNREVNIADINGEKRSDEWMQEAKTVSFADWFEGVKSALPIDDLALWGRVATAWGDHIAKLESKSFQPTLRLPLSPAFSIDMQVCGWLHWLQSRMDLSRRTVSLLISREDNAVGHLSIICRDIIPDDFLLMTDLARTLPYVDDLSTAKATAFPAADNASSSASSSALDGRFKPDGTWIDFVRTGAVVA